MSHRIKLTYFKPSGKYYTDGEYQTERAQWWDVIDEIKEMRRGGKLPGFCEGGGKWSIIHVDGDDHPGGYPVLIMPEHATNHAG